MFGLGHYIYAGEDIPEVESAPAAPAQPEPKKELEFLKKGTTDWDNVKTYIEANKALGYEKIEAQVSRRFKLSPAIKKEIKTLIES